MFSRGQRLVSMLALVGLWLALSARADAQAAPVVRFALVIGNNRAPDIESLRYADDDALGMHQLFLDANIDSRLIASFDGRAVTYEFGELDTLVPAYAATIHKSQGSEYPAVVIPVLTQHYAMLQRNLLYTGVTRGKRLVVLVGQKKAVAIAVRNVSGRRRWSKLREWL